ncbi:MAG: glycosyltransferase [Solirubrobacteraceae bacterium]
MAVRGAKWNMVACLTVGLLNFMYAIVLSRILDNRSYSQFAAAQGLVLCASAVATAAVPWVLAQGIARARSTAERDNAIRFGIVIGIGGGMVGCGVVAAVASQFAGASMLLVLASTTVLVFANTVTMGWLQGSDHLRKLSVLFVVEAALKTVAGLLLAYVFGLGSTGAIAAIAIGCLCYLFWWPRPSKGNGRLWRCATSNRDLWQRALGIAGVQGLVAVMSAIDLVLVAILPNTASAAASYQASVIIARVPLFVASAISISFFASLSRRPFDEPLVARAVRMYFVVALPLAAVIASTPATVLLTVFPARYGMLTELLRFTAIAGFAIGGLNLVTTFFQAASDYSCIWWQAAGLLGYIAALLIGWRVAGVVGFAVGAACGSVVALALLAHYLSSRQAVHVLRGVPLLEPLVLAGLLILVRSHVVVWLTFAAATLLRAAARFYTSSTLAHQSAHAHTPRFAGMGGVIGLTTRSDTRRERGENKGRRDTAMRRLTPKVDINHVRARLGRKGNADRTNLGLHRAVVPYRRFGILSQPPGTDPHIRCLRGRRRELGADPIRLRLGGHQLGNPTPLRLVHDSRPQVPTNGDNAPSTVVAEALPALLTDRPGGTPWRRRGGQDPSRQHVVISIYDDIHNPHYNGGGAIVVQKVARRLAEDFRTTVVTASRRRGMRVQDGVVYRYLPVVWAGPRAGQLLFHVLLPFMARRIQHDVWMESFTPPFSTSLLPLASPARVLGIAQSLSGDEMSRKYHLPFDGIERFGLRCYGDIVALNDAQRELIQRLSPATAVHVIPNGIEPRDIVDAGLGKGEHILFLGRIDVHGKGMDLLLAAYAIAAPPMPLILAGAGTTVEERKLGALLARTCGDVRWLGHVEGARKNDLLERSAFLVMSSRDESFGIAALEGMSYGKPVLHFDLPNLRWMRESGDVAVKAFDVDELASKMLQLAVDEQMRHQLGTKAGLAVQRFTWEHTTSSYLSLVHEVLDVGRPS